jgi:prophage antirepressor-like protein
MMQVKPINTIIYNDGELELEISLNKDNIWLIANDIANIFDVNRPAIVKHIGNIYKTEELSKNTTCSILEQVTADGKKRKVNFYNLDMIISVGYRINSKKATKFRQWASNVLTKYIESGYSINNDKLTQLRLSTLETYVERIKQEFEKKDKKANLKINHILNIIETKDVKPKQGIFYNGQIFDAYSFVSDLIRDAKSSVFLVDNYIDDSVLTLFSKNQNIEVILYTKTISKQLKLDLEKYNAQYKTIKIKTFKDSHDRFMIIDDIDVYHIGASLKDLGKKWFVFSKLDIDTLNILERLESIQ